MYSVFLLVLFTITFSSFGLRSASQSVYVKYNALTNSYDLNLGYAPEDDVVVALNFTFSTNKTGWSDLSAWTNGSFPSPITAYLLGFSEVHYDVQKYAFYNNTVQGYCNRSKLCKNLYSWLSTNLAWMKRQIILHRNVDPFWFQTELMLWQIQGMDDAFNNRPSVPNITSNPENLKIDPFGLYLLQALDDISDLSPALGEPVAESRKGMKCSALIKLLPGNSDLITSHVTWQGYQSLLKVMKRYETNWRLTASSDDSIIPGSWQTFSSYPISMSSGDDFYIMKSGLVTLETTNGIYNLSLYPIILNGSTSTVPEFLRTMVANRLATDGKSWVYWFKRYNSGTYNNQWMIVDYKKFQPGKPLPSQNVLYIAEQLPGIMEYADVTQVLAKETYWSSYNVPYFSSIWNISGYPAMAKKYGDFYTHDKTARALIFKRDHKKVVDLQSAIKLMRYNDYTHDPLSRCNCTPPYSAELAISARCDLNPISGSYPFSSLGHRNHGGTDMKMVNFEMFSTGSFIGICGPTYDPLPPFQWSKSDYKKRVSHIGHPDLFDFKPIKTPW